MSALVLPVVRVVPNLVHVEDVARSVDDDHGRLILGVVQLLIILALFGPFEPHLDVHNTVSLTGNSLGSNAGVAVAQVETELHCHLFELHSSQPFKVPPTRLSQWYLNYSISCLICQYKYTLEGISFEIKEVNYSQGGCILQSLTF